MADIIMIPKNGKASSHFKDYRGISLLSNISKLVERIIKNRLYKHLEENKTINLFQSGFIKIKVQLKTYFPLLKKIGECFQKSKVGGIFFDLSKAFDKVCHLGLLYKLIKLCIPKYLIIFVKNFRYGAF